MAETKKIKTALVSVSRKDGIDALLQKLHGEGVALLATDGTCRYVRQLGLPCRTVEDVTRFPAILGGRVKTLHPKIFGGILARRAVAEDKAQLLQYGIPEIDLIIADLYPFEDAVAGGACDDDIVEMIDVGGHSLLRAGAKNFRDVLVVSGSDAYALLSDLLQRKGPCSDLEDRLLFAARAFEICRDYDTAIGAWLRSRSREGAFQADRVSNVKNGE